MFLLKCSCHRYRFVVNIVVVVSEVAFVAVVGVAATSIVVRV